MAVIVHGGGGGGAFDGAVADKLTFENITPVFELSVDIAGGALDVLSVRSPSNTSDLAVGFKVTNGEFGWSGGESEITEIIDESNFKVEDDAGSSFSDKTVHCWDPSLEPATPATDKGVFFVGDVPTYSEGATVGQNGERVLQYKNDKGDTLKLQSGVSSIFRNEDDEVGIQFMNSTDAAATRSLYGGGLRIWKNKSGEGSKVIIGSLTAAPIMFGCDPMGGGGWIECGLGGKISMGVPSFMGGPAPTERVDLQDGAVAFVHYGSQADPVVATEPPDPSDVTNCHIYSKDVGGVTKLFLKRRNAGSWEDVEITTA